MIVCLTGIATHLVLKVIENFKTTLILSCPKLNVNDFYLTYWKLQHTVQEERVQAILNGRGAEGTCTPSTSMQPPVAGDSEMLVHVPPPPQIRASHVSNTSIFCVFIFFLWYQNNQFVYHSFNGNKTAAMVVVDSFSWCLILHCT